jgi:hypothetical protein
MPLISASIKSGKIYKHCSTGNVYTVLHLANTAVTRDGHPQTVVYLGANGNVWARPLTEFAQKFVRLYDGANKADDPY